MKKTTVLVTLIAIIVSLFAMPVFAADDSCSAEVDYLAVAVVQRAAGDTTGMLLSVNCALQFSPDDATSLRLRAIALCDRGDTEKAVEDFTRYIEVTPNKAEGYNYRGWALFLSGELDAAMDDLNYAIELDEDLAYAYNNRGLVWQEMGELEKARADFEMAIELNLPQAWAEINLFNLDQYEANAAQG